MPYHSRLLKLLKPAKTALVSEPKGKLAVKLKEAAAMLSISQSTLRRKIEEREIAVCRASRHITISVAELERFLARNTVKL